jgi:hypothetical protein
MLFPDLHHQDTDQPPAGADPSNPDQPTRPEPHSPQPAATAADPDQQRSEDWPILGWQWASLVAVLLGGQAVLLVLTTWTLATGASHGWPTPIVLALGLLVRLVPDALKLAEWAATAHSWTPPVDRHLHLGIAIAALVLANLVALAA